MSKYFKPDSAFGEEAECAVCCTLWTDPVEISGCEHIFCRACVEGLKTCPTCCGPLEKVNTPNRAIIRMLMRVRGSCSSCAWKGTYKQFKEKHPVCLKEGETMEQQAAAAAAATPVASADQEVHMNDYYLEKDAAVDVSRRPGTARVGVRGASAGVSPASPSSTAAAPGGPSDAEILQRWWGEVNGLRASDYGFSPDQFASLKDLFPEFATYNPDSGHLELSWRDACRFLRFNNYPNHPADVEDLFETTVQSAQSGSINFESLCLWLSLNAPNPGPRYSMDSESYEAILRVAQVLDVEKTGLFTLDQCHFLAEQYFERDVEAEEWSELKPILQEKSDNIRQSFKMNVSSGARAKFAQPQADVKLPFHDILLTFARHTQELNRRKAEWEKGQSVIQRIERMMRYYEPSGMENMRQNLANFRGDEENLLMTLIAVYGPEPT